VAASDVMSPRLDEVIMIACACHFASDRTLSDVQEHCAATMASFKAPKGVVFVDVLPKNPSGKILKRLVPSRVD
jgi:acyl-CoA synthetase (AMP-forming)/AMP-acid ligase II